MLTRVHAVSPDPEVQTIGKVGSLLRHGYRNVESDSPRQLDFSERAGVIVGSRRRTFLIDTGKLLGQPGLNFC